MNESEKRNKCEKIVREFYVKYAQVVLQERIPFEGDHNKVQMNKWFNLLMGEIDTVTNDLSLWRTGGLHLPLFINIYYDVPNTQPSPTPTTRFLLEQWSCTHEPFEKPLPQKAESLQLFLPPTLYRKCVVLLRTLSSYLKLLPASKLFREKKRNKLSPVKLKFHFSSSTHSSSFAQQKSITKEQKIGHLDTPFGKLSLSCLYRSDCSSLLPQDNLLDSRVIIQDYDPQLEQCKRSEELEELKKYNVKASDPIVINTHGNNSQSSNNNRSSTEHTSRTRSSPLSAATYAAACGSPSASPSPSPSLSTFSTLVPHRSITSPSSSLTTDYLRASPSSYNSPPLFISYANRNPSLAQSAPNQLFFPPTQSPPTVSVMSKSFGNNSLSTSATTYFSSNLSVAVPEEDKSSSLAGFQEQAFANMALSSSEAEVGSFVNRCKLPLERDKDKDKFFSINLSKQLSSLSKLQEVDKELDKFRKVEKDLLSLMSEF